MESLVTVFIPVYNCEKYIGEALDSILNQTYKNLEILIVDDASTDRSVEIIKSYRDKRIKLIENKKNKGIPHNRNIGLREANGKYLAIMDADDISNKYRIEKQVKYLEENENIDVVASYFTRFGKKINRLVKSPKTDEEIKANLIFSSPIANPSTMIRMSTVYKYSLEYNLECIVAQDYEMWTQIAKVGKFGVIEESLLYYRTGHENITNKSKRNRVLMRKNIIDKIHEDMINFYDLRLTKREIEIFNEIFDDNAKLDLDNMRLDEYIKMLNNLENNNRYIDKDIFKRVLNNNISDSIYSRNISLIRKIELYIKLNLNQSISAKVINIIYFMIRDVYRVINKINL